MPLFEETMQPSFEVRIQDRVDKNVSWWRDSTVANSSFALWSKSSQFLWTIKDFTFKGSKSTASRFAEINTAAPRVSLGLELKWWDNESKMRCAVFLWFWAKRRAVLTWAAMQEKTKSWFCSAILSASASWDSNKANSPRQNEANRVIMKASSTILGREASLALWMQRSRFLLAELHWDATEL